MTNVPRDRIIALGIFGLTVLQLAVATFVPGLGQFEGKGLGARLFGHPTMMLVVPALYSGSCSPLGPG